MTVTLEYEVMTTDDKIEPTSTNGEGDIIEKKQRKQRKQRERPRFKSNEEREKYHYELRRERARVMKMSEIYNCVKNSEKPETQVLLKLIVDGIYNEMHLYDPVQPIKKQFPGVIYNTNV
jgi:hypothetical protein